MGRARQALRDAGVAQFVETNQDKLDPSDALKFLTSPSILADGKLVAGSRGSTAGCSILNWEKVTKDLRALK
ncbi:MAG: hypothetical protein ACXVB9_13970 [Bdellovibrionota bacterium]